MTTRNSCGEDKSVLDGPRVVAIAGPFSDSGKTTLACALLARLASDRPWAAMKISVATPDHRCSRTGLPCECFLYPGKTRLQEGECAIGKTGKDTHRLRAAGGDPLYWLQTTQDVAMDATREALAGLPSERPLLVEGAGPVRIGRADFGIVVAPADGREPKSGWWDLMPNAHALMLTTRDGDGERDSMIRKAHAAGLAEECFVGAFADDKAPDIAALAARILQKP